MLLKIRKLLAFNIAFLLLSMTLGSLVPNAVAAPPEPTEEWVVLYNGPAVDDDYGRAITTDAVGNVYVTGRSFGIGTNRDIATIKYDPDGNQLWERRYNGLGDYRDEPSAIAVDPFGDIYVTGWCTGATTWYDILVLKYDPAGNLLWDAIYDGGFDSDHAQDLVIDSAGNVYITGQSAGHGAHFDCITIKYDPSGNKLWEARFDGVGHSFDSGREIELDSSGNVIITGFTARVAWTNFDFLTIKYDADGNEIWRQIYNGPADGDDYGWTLVIDPSDNIYTSGLSTGIGTGADCTTISYDPAGNQRWLATYNGPGNDQDQIYRSAIDANGNIVVTGRSMDAALVYDYITIAYDQAGSQLWFARYDGPVSGRDDAYGIAADPLGNVYVSGFSTGGSLDHDAVIIGYDSSGNQLWLKRYNGIGNGNDIAFEMALDPFGNLFATGSTFVGGTNNDLLTIKYSLPLAAEQAAEMLITSVESMELASGTENSLTSKLDNAVKSIENDNDGAAVNQLESFQNQAEALEGNKLTTEEADALSGAVQSIINTIEQI
jgi:uncharacterized delta-60 repeat protein